MINNDPIRAKYRPTLTTPLFRYNGGVDHYRVKKDGRGMSVDDMTFFSNLIELIEVSSMFKFSSLKSAIF